VATYFQNVWQGMAPDHYPALLAADFVFDFAPGDSAGTYWTAGTWAWPDLVDG
jgi:hypothetical protein